MSNSPDNEKLYKEREKRVMDTVGLKKADRVPFVTLSDFYFTASQGLNCKETMYDYDRAAEAYQKTQKKVNWDLSGLFTTLFPGKIMDIMGVKAFSWPGAISPASRLNDNLLYQWNEKEYLTADEVDDYLKDPSGFTVRKLMPRLATTLEPLEALPMSLAPFGDGYSVFLSLPMLAGLLSGVTSKLEEASKEAFKYQAAQQNLRANLEKMGYPILTQCIVPCPFDFVGDQFRGMKGTMLDMYRQPDKLMALVNFFESIQLESAIRLASMMQSNRVFVPLHKGSAGFMSDEQFKQFYWPQLKRYSLGLLDNGLVPILFYEGDYTPRLKYLAELPPGKIMGHYDKIDRKKHKEILGDVMCFWGDIPASLLVSGTPEQVMDYVKELIDFFPDGGLIVDGAASGMPIESKTENVMAAAETVFEYGRY